MQSVTNANFGPLLAYLIPGATALFGISEFIRETSRSIGDLKV